MKGIVISNAGPLIVLAKLNQLHLLRDLYGKVYFSSVVYHEVVTMGIKKGQEDAIILKTFLHQEEWNPIKIIDLPKEIKQLTLDRGEKESIALALKRKADLFLIDEEHGRHEARRLGLKIRGSAGILIEAYKREAIDKHRLLFYFNQIKSRNDIWISSELINRLMVELKL